MVKKSKKQFIVKKYIMAESAAHALKIEKKFDADDCWIDEDWKKNQSKTEDAIGIGYNSADD